MAERFNKQQTHKSDFRPETSFPLILNQVSSRPDALNNADSISDDDLITSLQSRLENCRARQVFEWELTRRGTSNGSPPNYYYGAI
ncbi:MAG: hypothetical protein M3209_21140 [Acidobacteriota bacterium]|nr:hypothetical protein [Acidobacteriota bacterium]